MKLKALKTPLLILLTLVFIILLALQFVGSKVPNSFSFGTGREGGGYHSFSLVYKGILESVGVELNLEPMAGSVEVLEALRTGAVDAGLVQGGIASAKDRDDLQTLGSLFYEPIWVFYRKSIQLEYLFDLKGKNIAIGEEGSGTRPLALTLLENNEVNENNSNLLPLSGKGAINQLLSGEVDAAFFVTSPQSQLVAKLLHHPEVDLFSFRRDLAYSSTYPYLTSLTLGEGLIELDTNIPAEDKVLLATTASLVTRKDIHPDLIPLLVNVISQVHKRSGLFEAKDQFPSVKFVDLPLNPDAEHFIIHGPGFLQTVFSPRVAIAIDRIKLIIVPLLALAFPLLKGVMPLYRWRTRRKIFRWYAELRDTDTRLEELTSSTLIEEEITRMKELEQELISQVSVPLPYMGEFYGLRVHIRLILRQLEEKSLEHRRKEEDIETQNTSTA